MPLMNRENNSQRLIVSVTSGLCNRLWVLSCALRLADQCKRGVCLLWLPRTGRAGLAYQGPESSSFDDFFLPDIEGLDGVSALTEPPVLGPDAVGLDYSDLHELTLAVQAGEPLPVTPELVAKATTPRVLDVRDPAVAAARDVWINLSTLPVGGPGDAMERYLTYPEQPGVNRKDAYLESLSGYARRIRPRPEEQRLVDRLVGGMREAPGGVRLVGIHVRATDLKQRHAIDRNARLAGMIHALTCTPGRGARIFLASDSEAWLTEFVQKSLWPQARTAVTTYENPVKYENSEAGARAAIVDLYALAACDVIYGTAGSSFSSYAWLLSDAEFRIHS